ncbi:MAG: metalloregulator ArsR/SmtB family transcription factor [Pseudomonadales bacterium]|nr:metalloregulator ArsR/SmtB family transcription factor [Pseudomonadales bacterium]
MASQQLDDVFSALADPTRRAILARLAQGDASVTELAEPFAISQPAVSKHLKVLENARLISRTRNEQKRLAHLNAEPLVSAAEWIRAFEAFWTKSFDELDQLLIEMKNNNGK